jgi:hypothetical protein
MLRNVTMPGHAIGGATVSSVRRLLTIVIRLALVAALGAAVRQVLLERSPRRALNGTEPVIGSLDTWAAVPRRPAG